MGLFKKIDNPTSALALINTLQNVINEFDRHPIVKSDIRILKEGLQRLQNYFVYDK